LKVQGNIGNGGGRMHDNIISFVARGSLSGKTSLIERIIEELKRRGRKVAAIKHSQHIQPLDKEGKDTYRFAQRGADRVMLFSQSCLFLYEQQGPDLDYLISIATRGVDIVIIEGFKQGPFKKIEVFNGQFYQIPLCVETPSPDFIALVSNEALQLTLPCYGFEEIPALCDMIETVSGL